MHPDTEIRRLLDLMPASGRMLTKIVSKPQQSRVIEVPFPGPWNRDARRIQINFSLWQQLPEPQRDLLLLREVSWLLKVRWFKPDLYQGIALAGAIASIAELTQGDAVGVAAAAGVTALAVNRIWREARGTRLQIGADEAALQVAQRRGYSAVAAADHLLNAIASAAELEGRSSQNFVELIRSQQLRSLANRTPVGVPDRVRNEL
ncbi:protein of unknown function (DUF3318) [Rubidibacter lacunae KORDI 51-2]|uniref:DUF3318 domain-containing protein n=1 Tax=Rubidibacter lacunae KORDI 51-2 TaxID=582515 RepID=U5DS85_9CHRO|nr:DUF3318 domain-containing protein [Rubidibacter lacunae]ERN42540.1 protein of unknown function (DUF3318) [Rubidibacter lacunae KORDI 51-2]